MGGKDFNNSHHESELICNTCSSITKRANNTEWKLVTEDIVKKEILIKRVTVEEILSILTQERQWHIIK